MPGAPEVWDEIAPFYDETRNLPGDVAEILVSRLADELVRLHVDHLLEAGVGTGRIALPLADAAGVRLVGLDRSSGMLARLRAKRRGDRPFIVQGDVLRPPFRRVFDAVLFSHVLHLIGDLGALAGAIRSVVRPAGWVLVLDSHACLRAEEHRTDSAVRRHLTGDVPRSGQRMAEGLRETFSEIVQALDAVSRPSAVLLRAQVTGTLRGHLDMTRRRVWSTWRGFTPEEMARAVDAAEMDLVSEGADLDAPFSDPFGVDLLAARIGAPSS